MISVTGLDLAAGRGVSAVATLECEVAPMPRLREQLCGEVTSDSGIVAALVDAAPAIVSIDAPLSLPAPVMAALSAEVGGPRTQGSPYTRAAERDPQWAHIGVRPLPVSFLAGLTFRAIALLPQLREAIPDVTIIEVFPTATLRILGIGLHETHTRRRPKTAPDVRAAVQSELRAHIAGIPDPQESLLGADLLDALAAALTAAFHLRGETQRLGDPGEGQIIVPVLPTA